MGEEPGTIEKWEDLEGDTRTALQGQPEILPPTEFVKVEKNLASLGFFTPSSKRLRNAQEKSFTITTVADGKRMELKGTIIPSAKYGLPITADQDKWIALCKILTDILRKEGRVTNPISFTSAEILRLLRKHRHSGKNYHDVEEWLDVLFSTTIFSEGVVYLAHEKRRVKDRFRVFERAVSLGKELPDGKVADKNYVWFSDWQLQNINANHLLPIDLEAYRELKNHISKALVPLLQVWLYATRDNGIFEKRYDELCQILNIRQYPYLSLITRTLAPSLDELAERGYLADWRIERTSDDEHYKILFYHGEKFHRDRRARLNRKRAPDEKSPAGDPIDGPSPMTNRTRPRQPSIELEPAPARFDPQLVAEFTGRGVTEKKALEVLAKLKPGQDVAAQLEFGEYMVKNSRTPITNPPGFYIRMIESNMSIPESFETTAKRTAREEKERKERERRAAESARQLLEWDYDDYCARETSSFIAENSTIFEAIMETKRIENREQHPSASPEMIESFARSLARNEIEKQVPLLTFEEFVEKNRQDPDFFLKPVGPSPDADPETASADQPTHQPVMTHDVVVPPEIAVTDEPVIIPLDPPVMMAEEGGVAIQPAPEAATQPAISELEPAIELVSAPPRPETGGDAAQVGIG
jgi:hypothetical protein